MSNVCLECDGEFDSERSLHAHIKKHGIYLHDYFVKHFARRNLLTQKLMPFKNKESYFEDDFSNIEELREWCEIEKPEIVKNYIIDKLRSRIKSKDLKVAPNEIELYTSCLPNIDSYRKHYESWTYACEFVGIKPMFAGKLPSEFNNDYSSSLIITDTREQEPLFFPNQKVSKLDVGDYAIIEGFDYTYVDRKSESDFKGTLSKDNFERFRRELLRCRSLNCYLFVVVEASLEGMEDSNRDSYHRANLKYIYHKMRLIQHEFFDCCQFVFSGSRKSSELIIPKILNVGKKLWKTDLQHFLNKKKL